jgi:hypothetical protein
MVTKKKCGTSKMKRVMSGGKGKVSRYTQKFKQSYNRFIKIGDNDDDNSKLKKMEEWGRMRGIYKFLKYQNKKYTGESGDEKTALEKMEENINRTPNNEGYKSAISCFEQSENDILSGEEKCIPEEDYIKSVGGMDTTSEDTSSVYDNNAAPAVTEETPAATEETPAATEETPAATEETPAATEETPAVTEETPAATEETPAATEETPAATEETPAATEETPAATEETPAVTEETPAAPAADEATPAADEATPAADEAAPAEADAQEETPAAPVDEAAAAPVDDTGDTTEQTEQTEEEKPLEQQGGRSKCRPRSSRRGMSMKSKKGRRTRRKQRVGRR